MTTESQREAFEKWYADQFPNVVEWSDDYLFNGGKEHKDDMRTVWQAARTADREKMMAFGRWINANTDFFWDEKEMLTAIDTFESQWKGK